MDQGMSAYATGQLLGILIVGFALGLFTLHQGKKHGQDALGWGGLAACVAGAFVLGILLAGPLALLFNWLIRREAAKAAQTPAAAWPEAGPEHISQ
jgi:MFS family permease